jgi:hypothetical protein
MTTTKEVGRLARGGAGGFLNPPTHPEHDWHIETDLRRRPENRGFMALNSAIDCDWLADGTRASARRKLAEWVRPALDSPEVQAWIHQVLGYFRGCYQGNADLGEKSWHVSNLKIDNRDPMTSVDTHAGVRLIRKYYPEFLPTAEHFAKAKWGT